MSNSEQASIYPTLYSLISSMFSNFGLFPRPYSLIKGPTFIEFWNFYQGLQKFSSLMGFLLHKFAHFVHALCLFKALCLFFLTNFPGPTVIPCPTSIPDSRVHWGFMIHVALPKLPYNQFQSVQLEAYCSSLCTLMRAICYKIMEPKIYFMKDM